VGFDWPDAPSCLAKVVEETREVEEAMEGADREALEEEIGDLLFASVSLARKLGVDAESALRRANQKFCARFQGVEEELRKLGKSPADSDLEEMDQLWERQKVKGR
jgi:ATP diphosphatase